MLRVHLVYKMGADADSRGEWVTGSVLTGKESLREAGGSREDGQGSCRWRGDGKAPQMVATEWAGPGGRHARGYWGGLSSFSLALALLSSCPAGPAIKAAAMKRAGTAAAKSANEPDVPLQNRLV